MTTKEMLANIIAAEPKNAERPVIFDGPDQAQIVTEVIDALAKRGDIFVRSKCLVHVVYDAGSPDWLKTPRGAPVVEGILEKRLQEMISESVFFMSAETKDKKAKRVKIPEWIPKMVLARGEWPKFEVLEGVSNSPPLRHDGSVSTTPGYDPDTRYIFDPGGARFPDINSEPSQADAQGAYQELVEPFCSFRFVADSDRAATAAMILSIVGRAAIKGNTPMFGIGAPTPGSGKGLLADLVTIIANGRESPKMSNSASADDTRKELLALAMRAPSCVVIDNVEGDLGNHVLAMALTSGEIIGRVLGFSKMVEVSTRFVWAYTGNNVGLKGDLGRRVVPIDQDPKCEHPEDRDDFKHPDVKAYVRRERPRLVAAALTILSAHARAGRPRPPGLPRKGSFESWDDVVRAAVLWSGGADPLEGCKRIREAGDEDFDRLSELLHAWRDYIGDEELSATDVVRRSKAVVQGERREKRDAFAEALERFCDEEPKAQKLGNMLGRRKGRIASRLRLEKRKTKKSSLWRVVAEGQVAPGGTSSQPDRN